MVQITTILGASIVNTVSEQSLATWTIAANSLNDGDMLKLHAQVTYLNSSGSPCSFSLFISVAGDDQTINTQAHNSSGTTFQSVGALWLVRAGSNLLLTLQPTGLGFGNSQYLLHSYAPTFSSNFDIVLSGQFSVANANISATCNSANLIQY